MTMMNAGDYTPHMLVNPEANVMVTTGVAEFENGKKLIVIIVETPTGSERYFVPPKMAEHIIVQLQASIDQARSKLEVVKNNLFIPITRNGEESDEDVVPDQQGD